MGADQTPDPTAWSDDQLDSLLDALAERAAERDDLHLPGSGASRRGVLAGLLGLGGAAAGAGVASAIGENESYGSSSGVVGTDSEPLNEANVEDLHAQDAQVDNLLETEQIQSGPKPADASSRLLTVDFSDSGDVRSNVWSGSVSTSSVTTASVGRSGMALVYGEKSSDFGTRFSDLVLVSGSNAAAIGSETQSSPASRTYSGGVGVEITMSSGTYEVTVLSFGGIGGV